MRLYSLILVLTTLLISTTHIKCEDVINIVVLLSSSQRPSLNSITRAVQLVEGSGASHLKINLEYIEVNRKDVTESIKKLCSLFYDGISIILDLLRFTWVGQEEAILRSRVVNLKADFSITPFLDTLEKIIAQREGNDAVFIFQNDEDLMEGIYYIVEKSNLRVLPVNALLPDSLQQIETLRPAPGYYAIFAYAENMANIFEKVSAGKSMKNMDKWHLVYLNAVSHNYDFLHFPRNITVIRPNELLTCLLVSMSEGCSSKLIHSLKDRLFAEMIEKIIAVNSIEKIPLQKVDCEETFDKDDVYQINRNLSILLMREFDQSKLLKIAENDLISFDLNLSIHKIESGGLETIATWNNGNLDISTKNSMKPALRFFRIGTTEAIPWSSIKKDPLTQEILLDENGNPIWEGYCIDLIAKLAEKMSFDYEIVHPRKGTFGKRAMNGSWDGLVGDLVTGETDIAVAALKMTAEREEVIDFVAPYFEQTGISIVIRRPIRQTSLFKFMTVLRLEVWLSIVAALVATAIMMWFLDKYSPYSARNNAKAYPYPCRDFSLKESFWFALTSFTPQGGGEVPKSISARTLVAAYWLFVVLMLATFTANLAAFLTVERMQTPVQSLEQLARQSRINYTVVEGSDTHKYFINMKFAEDTLYRLWKELTLNATSDQSQYRIWDYPIKEQYGHILLAINSSNPVKNASEGFRLVSEHENADFAFIHDAAEIKYEVAKNCNLTEIGEVFAEQPYAIAIQQGSQLQDELTYAVLELQKDRYFEGLNAKYWNNSVKKECDNVDESEGITLESLGGVFIATLFGLGLAMITLFFEVLYYKRKETNITKVKPFEQKDINVLKPALKKKKSNIWAAYDASKVTKSKTGEITLVSDFIPTRKRNKKITYIDPRDPIHGPFYYE